MSICLYAYILMISCQALLNHQASWWLSGKESACNAGDPDNHDGMVMVWSLNRDLDILECVKSSEPQEASLQTKLVEVMEFQLSYLKSLKMMQLKYCTQYVSKFGKLSSSNRTGKDQFSFQSQRRAVPKDVQTAIKLCSFYMLVRLCSKSFKLDFSSELRTSRCTSWIQKRQRNQRSNCQHPLAHRKSKGIPEKHLLHQLC